MPVGWIEPVAEASVLQWLHDGRRGRSALFVALYGEREPGVTGDGPSLIRLGEQERA